MEGFGPSCLGMVTGSAHGCHRSPAPTSLLGGPWYRPATALNIWIVPYTGYRVSQCIREAVHACEARSTVQVHEARSTDGAPPLWRRVQRRTAEYQLFEVGATQCVRASSYVRPCCSVFRVLPSNLRSTFELSVHPSPRRPGCSRGTTSPLCISSRGTFLHFGRGLPHALDAPVECPMPMATPTVLGPGHATSQTLSPRSPYHCRP